MIHALQTLSLDFILIAGYPQSYMDEILDPFNLLIRLPIVLLALTVHEFSHAYFAYRMGDPTALSMGRCTLNPLKHLDPLGTICLMFAPIGWAKPVPVNPLNFRDPRKGDLITSAAGPASNVVQAILFALVIRIIVSWGDDIVQYVGPGSVTGLSVLFLMCKEAVFINVGLAVFNCLPIFPLDGYHIAYQLMKPESQQRFAGMARYGIYIILGLVFIGYLGKIPILWYIIAPPANLIITYIAGLPNV